MVLNEPKAQMSIVLTNSKNALNGLIRNYYDEGDLHHY